MKAKCTWPISWKDVINARAPTQELEYVIVPHNIAPNLQATKTFKSEILQIPVARNLTCLKIVRKVRFTETASFILYHTWKSSLYSFTGSEGTNCTQYNSIDLLSALYVRFLLIIWPITAFFIESFDRFRHKRLQHIWLTSCEIAVRSKHEIYDLSFAHKYCILHGTWHKADWEQYTYMRFYCTLAKFV